MQNMPHGRARSLLLVSGLHCWGPLRGAWRPFPSAHCLIQDLREGSNGTLLESPRVRSKSSSGSWTKDTCRGAEAGGALPTSCAGSPIGAATKARARVCRRSLPSKSTALAVRYAAVKGAAMLSKAGGCGPHLYGSHHRDAAQQRAHRHADAPLQHRVLHPHLHSALAWGTVVGWALAQVIDCLAARSEGQRLGWHRSNAGR